MMTPKMASWLLSLLGWRVEGEIPAEIRKFVAIAVPHTSAWDFPLGLLARRAIGREIRFLGKKSLFKPPFGGVMRWLGGYPVDRTSRSNLVDQVVAIFDSQEEFAIAIAPEGTREKVNRFRTGFYYIAKRAGVPIIPVKMDYGHKVVHYGEPFYPGDDAAADLQYFWNYFKGVQGKRKEAGIS